MSIRRRYPWLFVLLALVVSCSDSGPRKQSETADVLEIVDGDTIELTDGRKVRYMCINTAERGQPFYDEATELNRQLVQGKTVTLRFGGRRTDRYGRTLAMVDVDDIWIADTLIAAGLAVVYGFPDNAKYLPPLVAKQRTAIDARVGLWTILLDNTDGPYVASSTGHRFHRPTCTSAQKIKPDHRREYQSKRDAYYDGFSPCGQCGP